LFFLGKSRKKTVAESRSVSTLFYSSGYFQASVVITDGGVSHVAIILQGIGSVATRFGIHKVSTISGLTYQLIRKTVYQFGARIGQSIVLSGAIFHGKSAIAGKTDASHKIQVNLSV
jgi:hypothetical protein